MKKPFIIGIGGTCSNSGKTTVAVLLLKFLSQSDKGAENIRISSSAAGSVRGDGFGKWGAIKYTKTEIYTSLVQDKELLSLKDKDTGRFIAAGAEEVIWVKSPFQDLHEVLPLALDRLSYLDGIVVEGNSAIEFLKPDIVIFIFGNDKEHWKSGSERFAGGADIIIYGNASELPEISKTKRLFFGDRSGIRESQVFLAYIAELIDERNTERRDNEKGC